MSPIVHLPLVALIVILLGSAFEAAVAQQLSRRNAVRIPHFLAECLVDDDRRAVVNVLQQAPGSPAESILLRRLDGLRPCLGRVAARHEVRRIGMGFRPHMLRGQLAEALFEADFRGLGRPRRADLARIPAPRDPTSRSEASRIASSSSALGNFAMCVVRREPEAVVRLLATEPAFSDEAAVIRELAPHVEACAGERGSVEPNRATLRGFLAEELYRYSVALWQREAR